jgi:hypothetical protein
MGPMGNADLLRLIREKQEQIAALQQELDEAKKLLSGDLVEMPPPRPRSGRPRGNGNSSVAWAEAILHERGKPLHVNEIIGRIERRFRQQVRYATLVGNLSRMVKNKKTFHRFGPNVYGLAEWPREENE